MADLKLFEAALKSRPTSSYERDAVPKWEAANRALSLALDDSEHARRETDALRKQLVLAAEHIAELEFETARLGRSLELASRPVEVEEPAAPAVPVGPE